MALSWPWDSQIVVKKKYCSRERFIVTLDPGKFGHRKFCRIGDSTLLICHMNSCDHVKKVGYKSCEREDLKRF